MIYDSKNIMEKYVIHQSQTTFEADVADLQEIITFVALIRGMLHQSVDLAGFCFSIACS